MEKKTKKQLQSEINLLKQKLNQNRLNNEIKELKKEIKALEKRIRDFGELIPEKNVLEKNLDELAMILHEGNRDAVLNNKVLKKDGAPKGKIIFLGWDDLSEDAKEGRRLQAKYLIKHRNELKKLFFNT